MASNIRRGTIPYKTTGHGEYVDEVYSLKGFFGEWAHMYRRNNLAHPLRWSDDRLMYSGLDGAQLAAPDATDAGAMPLPILMGDGVRICLSQRSAAMPFCAKNVDYHQIRFYHRGSFLVETELGALKAEPGDFIVIPRGLIYRETPLAAEGNEVYVFETEATVQLAETLWDSVGYASLFIDYSEMDIPEPSGETGAEGEHELRVFYDGEWHSVVYDFDPCKDVIGWVGDPVLYKMNVWSVPASSTSHGHLPPPASAVLWGENRDFFFNAMSMPPSATVGPPDGSFGAPSHLNDYDEFWLTHVSEFSPETEGHLWLLPRTIAHPGIKLPHGPKKYVRSMRINFDTKAALAWTPEVQSLLFADPMAAKYTSFFGMPITAAPEKVQRRSAGS